MMMILGDSNSGQTQQGFPMADTVFRLTLVRHGQTNHNRLCILQGQMDTQLNDFGREQASLLARYLKRVGVHYDQVYSSDLNRAYETSKIICAGDTRWPIAIKRDSLLRERSYGKLQGLPMTTIRKIAASAPKASNLDVSPSWGPTSKIHRPEGGETLDEVRARVDAFCDRVMFPEAGHHQHILVVSHGGTIREFMKIFKYKYGAPIKSQDLVMTPNTGVSEFEIWLSDKQQIEQVRVNHLHKLPHLTFDVFNRDNPHVHLNNLHLRTAIEFDNTDQDLKRAGQLAPTLELKRPAEAATATRTSSNLNTTTTTTRSKATAAAATATTTSVAANVADEPQLNLQATGKAAS